jgi:hypothetical protein
MIVCTQNLDYTDYECCLFYFQKIKHAFPSPDKTSEEQHLACPQESSLYYWDGWLYRSLLFSLQYLSDLLNDRFDKER